MSKRYLSGASLAGDAVNRERVDYDFYATPESATLALLQKEPLISPIWEPACGMGHISKVIESQYQHVILKSSDLIDRGYGYGGIDFLDSGIPFHDEYCLKMEFNTIITNPPFNLFTEFVERGLQLTRMKLILFGKIQALEGAQRVAVLENSPLRTVYVFKKRQNPLRNGSPLDEKGKPWASTMCFAWYVWEKDYRGKPQIEWL